MILCIGELHESPRTVTSTFASTLRATICNTFTMVILLCGEPQRCNEAAKDSTGEQQIGRAGSTEDFQDENKKLQSNTAEWKRRYRLKDIYTLWA
ncbi:hypothetical protein QLX08_010842 [Tetragonisca angustula]|uniref:Uncharacterized protein n=1 Tax=Tetragonisca angustula TaxID=166442 RepID=A0AAW0ZCJ2_9HYME